MDKQAVHRVPGVLQRVQGVVHRVLGVPTTACSTPLGDNCSGPSGYSAALHEILDGAPCPPSWGTLPSGSRLRPAVFTSGFDPTPPRRCGFQTNGRESIHSLRESPRPQMPEGCCALLHAATLTPGPTWSVWCMPALPALPVPCARAWWPRQPPQNERRLTPHLLAIWWRSPRCRGRPHWHLQRQLPTDTEGDGHHTHSRSEGLRPGRPPVEETAGLPGPGSTRSEVLGRRDQTRVQRMSVGCDRRPLGSAGGRQPSHGGSQHQLGPTGRD